MNDVLNILKHTPIWVWGLFVFLVYRGVVAFKKRSVTLSRLLVLPIVFFMWALLSIWGELQAKPPAIAGFVIGILGGGVIGWKLWRNSGVYQHSTGLFERNGSVCTLIFILVAFVSKFALSVQLAYQPGLAFDTGFCAFFGGVSGLVDGVFWGNTVILLLQMRRSRSVSSHIPD